jgi:predicted fused transcriptional regulator/phosphomethylpyrimidine kinase
MIELSPKWVIELSSKPETGIGYQVISIVLKDGRRFDQVVVVEGRITQIRGREDIPFTEDQIARMLLTHEKWNFNAER